MVQKRNSHYAPKLVKTCEKLWVKGVSNFNCFVIDICHL